MKNDYTGTGGPAFPQPNNPEDYVRGMTMRDYFAAQAMLGYMNDCYDMDQWTRAKEAYAQADEMILARAAL